VCLFKIWCVFAKLKKAIISGVVGQDGSYLAELLLSKGYAVLGLMRRASYPHTSRIDHLESRYDQNDAEAPFKTVYADLTDPSSLRQAIDDFEPDEVYNLGAQSHVAVSFMTGESTLDINTLGCFRLLDLLRRHCDTSVRFYQASSSEMFGASPPPQNEHTPFLPQSPYGVSKVAAYYLTRMHRVAYGMFAANGILFNHESPRRGFNFVTRKITLGIAKLLVGEAESLQLGNLDASRDWGYAGDYVDAIYRIMQHHQADDFVISTGDAHTVRDFLAETFGMLGLEWQDFVVANARYHRPAEVPALLGDSSKARRLLGWEPKVSFRQLCAMMLENDLRDRGLTLDRARRRAAELKPAVTTPVR